MAMREEVLSICIADIKLHGNKGLTIDVSDAALGENEGAGHPV